jgi:hypothetical protein
VFPAGDHGLDRGDEVAGVVECVENPEDILAGGGIGADECLDEVIGETRVLHDILAAQQHDLRGLGRGFFERAKAVERVFVQIAQARINGRTAPSFEIAEADLIEDGSGGQHLGGAHAGGRRGRPCC